MAVRGFATDQKASTTLALIAEAFGAIGAVPARVLADRMACLKGGVVADVVIPTAEYVRLASHTASRQTSAMPMIPNRRGSWRTCVAMPNATLQSHC